MTAFRIRISGAKFVVVMTSTSTEVTASHVPTDGGLIRVETGVVPKRARDGPGKIPLQSELVPHHEGRGAHPIDFRAEDTLRPVDRLL